VVELVVTLVSKLLPPRFSEPSSHPLRPPPLK
jgi:hypothetical protein